MSVTFTSAMGHYSQTLPPGHMSGRGALVVSLDFELLWGVHDTLAADGGYRENLLGARDAVPRMLDLFAAYGIGVTWATVGFLFADGRDELEEFSPMFRPSYLNPKRDPYRVAMGASEREDPLKFAPSLIRQIAAVPRQEIASHTFSHYYCLEPGQTAEQFRADLDAAMAIAAAKGYEMRSLVVPRHQVRPDYFPVIRAAGLSAHRTNEKNFLNVPSSSGNEPKVRRALRLIDAYVPLTGANSVDWKSTSLDEYGLTDVHESRFLRPPIRALLPLEPLRVRRIVEAMEAAAREGKIFHLWWHPHNFGTYLDQNLANLKTILDAYKRLYERGSIQSLTMGEVADIAVLGTAAEAINLDAAPIQAR